MSALQKYKQQALKAAEENGKLRKKVGELYREIEELKLFRRLLKNLMHANMGEEYLEAEAALNTRFPGWSRPLPRG